MARQPFLVKVLGVLGFLVLAGIIVGGLVSQWMQKRKRAVFAEAEARGDYRLESVTRPEACPVAQPLAGLLPVNRSDGKVNDELWFAFDEAERANRPEEVKTLLRVDCKHQQVGTYSDGEAALAGVCDTEVIDLATKTVVDQATIRGSVPTTRKSSEGGTAALPAGNMLKYVSYLRKGSCWSEGDPVCGADGHTYANTCAARCAKVAIEHAGTCPPR